MGENYSVVSTVTWRREREGNSFHPLLAFRNLNTPDLTYGNDLVTFAPVLSELGRTVSLG